ncbi:MAG: HIRAN domain-containing protein [Candidatus Omnitrophota bacterium]
MKKTFIQPETAIGEIYCQIKGMPYAKGEGKPGEELRFERQPDNPHDPWAILVRNSESEEIGFLPREISHWAAKLTDEGKIYLTGCIPEGAVLSKTDRPRGWPLRLNIYLSEKGLDILRPNLSPNNEREALHELVRSTYESLDRYDSPETIQGMAERLGAAAQWNAAPETLLLISLFSGKAEEQRQKKRDSRLGRIQEALSQLSIGKAIHHRNLTLFPLRKQNGARADYVLLKTALESGEAIVKEVSEEGRIGELILLNRGLKPILIPEGEILVGAKQNRVVNISLIAAAQNSLQIPVSCVERGRWRFTTKNFQSTHYAHPKLRSRKLQSVRECRMSSGAAYSDQEAVWDEVAMNLKERHTRSDTESVTDSYRSSSERIREYKDLFALPGDAIGVLAGNGNRIVGMDCFDSSESFHQCWERLSDSYFMDAINYPDMTACPQKTARAFLDRIRNSLALCDSSIGLGNELIVQNQNCAGVGVWYSDSLCHLSAFAVE